MSTMKEQAVLFEEPKEDSKQTGRFAPEGVTVEVLGNSDTFLKVKVLDSSDEPEGWVFDELVDLKGTAPIGPLDKTKFALQCWREAVLSDANPHYMVAVAELRSKIARGEDNGGIGPFRLSQAEWDAGRIDKAFGLEGVRPRDISDWRLQCAMFGLMAHKAEAELRTELQKTKPDRDPTAAELYLAQLIGAAPAAAAARNPASNITVPFPGLPNPVQAETALKQIADALQPPLDAVKQVVIDAGKALLGSEPDDDEIVTKASDPLDGKAALGIPKSLKEPIANFKAKAPAIMANLMKVKEFGGLTDEDAAAILGNLGHESRGLTAFQEESPTIKGSAGGWGWAQWTGMGKGGRRRLFFEWVAAHGNPGPKSDEANFGFLVHELQTSHRRAITALKAAGGLRAKVEAFERIFEAAGIKHYPSREQWAKRALDAFNAK
jgi:hypothetical protein